MQNAEQAATLTVSPALQALREQIDRIDDEILRLISQRALCAQEVAEIKRAAGESDCFYRPEREAEVLRRIEATNPGPLEASVVVRFFRELMSECLALEKPLTVAFLGPAGTYTEQAAHKHFGLAAVTSPLTAIPDIFHAVESGACQFGVVPVENSTEGIIAQTLDCFLRSPLLIAGEVVLPIHHNLMSLSKNLRDVRCVLSHQQSLGQCRNWLDRHLPAAERQAVASNAEAARLAGSNAGYAAIAGASAANLYGLEILERNIEDEPDNTTRFLVIGKQQVGRTGNDRTSILISTRNDPGALYHVLEPFAQHGISLSKIESRPSHRAAWDYVFFIDALGHRDDEPLQKALAALPARINWLKILGSFPRAIG